MVIIPFRQVIPLSRSSETACDRVAIASPRSTANQAEVKVMAPGWVTYERVNSLDLPGQPLRSRIGRGLLPVSQPELGEHSSDVDFGSMRGDEKFLGYFPVGGSFGQQAQNLEFARSEASSVGRGALLWTQKRGCHLV